MLFFFAVALSTTVASQATRWVLPVADGGGDDPSPPSVHGYVASVEKGRVVVKPDKRDLSEAAKVQIQLSTKTDLFTAFGGLCTANELRAGQYIWVWYVSADSAKAGTPPRAAAVVVWSKDPADKPDLKTRWTYDKGK